MEIRFYSFPMLRDGTVAIEKKLRELEEWEREGMPLHQEEKDWMDYASLVLHQVEMGLK